MHRLLLCLLICIAAVFPESACAQSNDLQVMQQAMTLAGQGKVLAAIHQIESQDLDEQTAAQTLSLLYSFAGDGVKAEQLQPRRRKENAVTFPAGAAAAPAIEAVVDLARDRQLVIVNEAHDAPQHRELLRQLAGRLREVGFEYYAMEALNENPERLRERGCPVRWSGFYTNEAVFGQLVREVLTLGYTPVAYEAMFLASTGEVATDINAREAAQCENLVTRIFAQHPDARVVVHVGHDHVMEAPRKAGDKEILWLAARLKQATGIDPLTIDQTTHLRFEAQAGVKHGEPIIVTAADGKLLVGGHFAGQVDLQVFHPPVQNRDGRPDWMYRDGERVAVPLPEQIGVNAGRILVQAYFADESTEAVPADQFLLNADGPRPPLLLRPGEYRIVTQDHEGNETAEQTLSVPVPDNSAPDR